MTTRFVPSLLRRRTGIVFSVAFSGSVAVGAGCDWTSFDDLADTASLQSIESPEGFTRGTFGSLVYGYRGTPAGSTAAESRLAVSGGLGSPVGVFAAEGANGKVNLERPVFFSCEDVDDCGSDQNEDEGAAIGHMQRRMSVMLGELCVVVGIPGADDDRGQLNIRCESIPNFSEPVPGPMPGSRFGSAIAPLRPGSPIGGIVVGAPNADGGRGSALRLPEMGQAIRLGFPTDGDPTTTGANLGAALAAGTAESSDGPVDLVAVGAPGQPGVFLWVSGEEDDGEGGMRPTAIACDPDLVMGSSPGFGGVLTMGDFDGDGSDDLAVSYSGTTSMRPDRVHVFLLEPGADGCPSTATEVELTCPTTAPANGGDGVACAAGTSGFGEALTAGDIDGDGDDDLVVGAPSAVVDGNADAGAIFVYRGEAVVAGGAPDSARRESDPAVGARLGTTLTTVQIKNRTEIVTGAPGVSETIVVWCSGLPGDNPGDPGVDEGCRGTATAP